MEAAAAGAGGAAEAGRGRTPQEGGRNPQDPGPVQSGRAIQPLYEAGRGEDAPPEQGEVAQQTHGPSLKFWDGGGGGGGGGSGVTSNLR